MCVLTWYDPGLGEGEGWYSLDQDREQGVLKGTSAYPSGQYDYTHAHTSCSKLLPKATKLHSIT